MTTVAVKLSVALWRDVEAAAAARGVPADAIIRETLESSLRRRRPRQPRSCLDLAGDLVGHFDGPADLSTSTAYLAEAIQADYERPRRVRRR